MKNDAVVVIDGPYKGWVGYIQEEEMQGYLIVRLFSSDGTFSNLELPIDYVKIVEPQYITGNE